MPNPRETNIHQRSSNRVDVSSSFNVPSPDSLESKMLAQWKQGCDEAAQRYVNEFIRAVMDGIKKGHRIAESSMIKELNISDLTLENFTMIPFSKTNAQIYAYLLAKSAMKKQGYEVIYDDHISYYPATGIAHRKVFISW